MLALAFVAALQVASPQVAPHDTITPDSARADSARRRVQTLESVQVTAVRGGLAAPIAQTTVTKAELERRYAGQDVPLLLATEPGVTAFAESGVAANYSYMRIRGIDQTRINLTLDGVPLNEPEDQGLYFSNFPDFANSIESVQIQRGVGTSAHGVASYAGSVNFESIAIASVPRRGELQLTRGSFNTSRASAEYQTGLLPNGLAGYARASLHQTDGYRDNSGNRSRSYFLSGGWFGTRDILKLTTFGGISANEMAYLAAPLSVLERSPRANPLGEGENDNFHQAYAGASWTRMLSPAATVATTLYGFDAGGHFDIRFDPETFGIFNLRSRWGGLLSTVNWQGARSSASVGAHANRYARDHWLVLRPGAGNREYDNTGHKEEASAFAKGSWRAGSTTIFGDLQLRAVRFRYEPTAGSTVPEARQSWAFLNPKIGISHDLTTALHLFASAGMNGREPTRADMFAGADDLDPTTAADVLPLDRVRPESVRDVEAGIEWRGATLQLQANLFHMSFRDEIAPIGTVNAIGYTLRRNVDRSTRRGLEAHLAWRALPALALTGTASITDARIHEYREESDGSGTVYRDVVPLLTPKFTSSHGIRVDASRWLSLDLDGRYVSRQMLTNTNDDRFTVPPSWLADAGATLRLGEHAVLVQLRNVLNRRAYSAGYSDGTEPNYFIIAPRHVAVTARLGF